jgi:cytochrome b pre-mRNA-processing protein 3
MKIPFLLRDRQAGTITALYGAIVAQARSPAVYSAFGIPDTLEARFEVLVLHLALVLDRLAADPSGRDVGQAVFDRFCQDMDDHMREMGVGDLTVPKKMRRLADAFFGRREAYRDALGSEAELRDALVRNVFAGIGAEGAPGLAHYVQAVVISLSRHPPAEITSGRIAWPDPVAISGERAQNADPR